jgi:hypothetical protein
LSQNGGLIAQLFIEKYGNVKGLISIEGHMASEDCIHMRKVIKYTYGSFVTDGISELIVPLRTHPNM